MNKQFTLIGILLFLLISNTSCDRSDDTDVSQQVGLEKHDEKHLKGKMTVQGHVVDYEVLETSELYYEVVIKIDNQLLIGDVDYNKEDLSLDGHNAVLSRSQKKAFLTVGEELSKYLFKDESTDNFLMTEYTLLRLLEYWAKSPSNYKYQKVTIKGYQDNGLKGTNDGIACIRKNTYVTAVYDDASGRQYRDRKLVNGNRCLGRCGSGCPGTFTIASAWTKDCLDHDQCGRELGGSSNPFDSNCGDEYFQAADDYLFGVIRGCKG